MSINNSTLYVGRGVGENLISSRRRKPAQYRVVRVSSPCIDPPPHLSERLLTLLAPPGPFISAESIPIVFQLSVLSPPSLSLPLLLPLFFVPLLKRPKPVDFTYIVFEFFARFMPAA